MGYGVHAGARCSGHRASTCPIAKVEWPVHWDEMDDVSRFAEVARAFCVFVREAYELALPERLHLARRAAADLFAAGCVLPQGDGKAPRIEDKVEVPASWPGFGEFDHYREVFDP